MSRGFTLLEMMVTVAILGLLSSLLALAIRSLREPPQQEVFAALAVAREDAIRTGRAVVWRRDGAAVRFLPNGSSSGGRISAETRVVVIDPLTGGVRESK